MEKFNIDFLIKTPAESIILDLRLVFENLLREVGSYLNLESIFSNVQVIFSEFDMISDKQKNDIIDFGVDRIQKNKDLTISISNNYETYIKIILLREAYKCFVPLELQENRVVNVFIDQKVEIDLQKSKNLDKWKDIKRKSLVSYDFMEAEFDRLDKFLKQTSSENRPSTFQFFFSYIRKNVDLIEETEVKAFSLEKKGFFDKIFEDYTRKYSDYPEEILETIRIITKIFYKVKSYRSLLDYQHYFKEYKESGLIQTDLSLRKFTESMQWIKTNSNIAPTYQINWFALDIVSTLCIIKFHPIIETARIFTIIKQIPFFIFPAYSKNDFGIVVRGYILVPKAYLKDVISLLEKLKSEGYVLEKKLYILNNVNISTNLNCFTSRNIILNPEKKGYKKEYEIEFKLDYAYGNIKLNLSLFDWFLIDRIRYVSITGLGFERKTEILKSLKSDLLNEIESQNKMINELKDNLNIIHKSLEMKKTFLELIDKNKSYGFFYIKTVLKDYVTILGFISDKMNENPSINNYLQFQEFIKNHGITNAIEDNITLKKLKNKVVKDLISFSFKSKKNMFKIVEEYLCFYNLFKSFYTLKLFDLNSIKSIIEDEFLIKKIYQSKEEKLKNSYENHKIYKITNQMIEKRLEDLLNNNPPVIQPYLLGTLVGMAQLTKYYPTLILKDTLQTREGIEKIKWFFPRSSIINMSENNTNDKYIYFQLSIPNLNIREKLSLFSVFYNLFRKDIKSCKSYLYSIFNEAFSMKDFYDLEQEDFFYTKDLFEQFYPYVKNTFKRKELPILESNSNMTEDLWGKNKFISHLINEIEQRISRESIDFNLNNLTNLLNFNKNLQGNLLDLKKFKNFKSENFFKNYIKSIKIYPSFQSFGFGEYYVYFYPTDLNKIDFKHFLHNSFQKIKFPASFDNSNSFLIKYIWPYRTPNDKILNWLVKSKKTIREYCMFFVKKVFQIFHFNFNLSVNEWDLDPNYFKIYFQNILFNPNYKPPIPDLKEFNIGDLNISTYFTPESLEFKELIQLYSWKSIDIKSYLGSRNYTKVNHIIDLLKKKIISPLISVKNLDLKEKLIIILPNVKKEHNETIIKIFSFFNIGFIYEIEGEYFIQGFTEEIKFENGLMIKLYLPNCQLDEFEILFNLIFEHIEIKHFIILNDLINGKNLLKSIYQSLNFLKSYNPLKNLIWNNEDKKWMNHKLFTNKFEKIYPPLKIDD